MASYRIFSLIFAAGLAIVPAASAQLSIRSNLSDDRLAPHGSTYNGTIELRNESSTAQQAKVYQTDYLFASDGSNKFGAPGNHARSNAEWVTFSPGILLVQPGETATVHYEVSVPDDSTLVGTYWSMIMIEGIPDVSPESILAPDDDSRVGLLQITRYGYQVSTDVGGGHGNVSFLDVGLKRSGDGQSFLGFDFENTGISLLKPEVWIEIVDNSGKPVGRRDGAPVRVYPGTSVRQMIDCSDLPEGDYDVLVVVDAGADMVFGTQYSLRL